MRVYNSYSTEEIANLQKGASGSRLRQVITKSGAEDWYRRQVLQEVCQSRQLVYQQRLTLSRRFALDGLVPILEVRSAML